MKRKRTELDVDFIGEQGRSLTKEEEQLISDYIKAEKLKRAKKAAHNVAADKAQVKAVKKDSQSKKKAA